MAQPDILKKYQALWLKWAAKPGATEWNKPDTIAAKRQMLEEFGRWLQLKTDPLAKALGVAVRIYARLPLASHDQLPGLCFYPRADLICKKKWTQLESRCKETFKGTGTTLVSQSSTAVSLIT
jgi:Rad3-related DNA helicase